MQMIQHGLSNRSSLWAFLSLLTILETIHRKILRCRRLDQQVRFQHLPHRHHVSLQKSYHHGQQFGPIEEWLMTFHKRSGWHPGARLYSSSSSCSSLSFSGVVEGMSAGRMRISFSLFITPASDEIEETDDA